MSWCTTGMCGVCGGKKRLLDPQELELLMFVSHRVGTENRTHVFCKSSQGALKHWASFQPQKLFFVYLCFFFSSNIKLYYLLCD